MFPRQLRLRFVPLLAAAVALSGCGGGGPTLEATAHAPRQASDEVVREAEGQRVDWWMHGGTHASTTYVDEHVIPAARKAGVTLSRVPITDSADAVQRVVAQRRAGKKSDGAVDLIWTNGENFASGKKAGLWLDDWATTLPNARYLDPADPSITTDFGTPVDGQEAPWSRTAFAFASDAARVPTPPGDLDGLLAWASDHPGRFTYPASPYFTGSAGRRLRPTVGRAALATPVEHSSGPMTSR